MQSQPRMWWCIIYRWYGKISGVVTGVLIFTSLTYSLTILGIDTNLQFIFEGIIILAAVTLDCLKYVQKKLNIRKYFLMIKLKVVLIIYMINGTAFSLNWFKSNS